MAGPVKSMGYSKVQVQFPLLYGRQTFLTVVVAFTIHIHVFMPRTNEIKEAILALFCLIKF